MAYEDEDQPGKLATVFNPAHWPEASFVRDALRTESVGGALLLIAAALGILWINTPWWFSYTALANTVVGPASLHLDLTIAQWTADAGLALFFFVAGLELKREFLEGELRRPSRAVIPVTAAVTGVVVPALLYVGVVFVMDDPDALAGWAIPTATDIAFALAVLAIVGSHLPQSLRSFLLTLAVVDDVIAITIIALFYTDDLSPLPLLAATVPLLMFGVLVQRRITYWWLLVPLAAFTWALVHASGIHATVAGVLLALTVPVLPAKRSASRLRTVHPDADLAHKLDHRLRPLSAGVAVPLFAFFAAGVRIVDIDAAATFTDPVFVAVVVALIAGKTIGVFGGTYISARLTHAHTRAQVKWVDVLGVSLLTGIGFTVSLLIAELAYAPGTPQGDHVKLAVLLGSVAAAVLAVAVLIPRNAAYRSLEKDEEEMLERERREAAQAELTSTSSG